VRLGSNVDSRKPHPVSPPRQGLPGTSAPVTTLVLVNARTLPQDTVRALDTGRGRQSQRRGLRLKAHTATLSRILSSPLYTLTGGGVE
jgi:hypothetical protein